MGASASKSSGRIGAMRRSTPTPPANQRTVSIAAVKPENPRDMFYRDEVFNVKVTVTGTQAYKLQLGFAKGETHQTLGSRGKVQMYDFQNDGILVFPRVSTDTERTKTLKAVINTAQIVRLKVTEVIEDDTSNSEPPTPNPEPSVLAVTGDLHVVHRLRKYGTHSSNPNVNEHDSTIDKWLRYWTDWKIGPDNDPNNKDKYYTFMTDAVPSGDLVKAVAYKESSLSTASDAGQDLMQLTPAALNGMTTNHAKRENDIHALALGHNYAGTVATAAPRPMKYGTPTDNPVDNSFKWGIRWLIAKRVILAKGTNAIKIRDWWGPVGALRFYNGEKGNEVEYPAEVEKLYGEGKNPHPGNPNYLWPIKVDGTARQPAKTTATPKNPPAENPENPPEA